MNITYTPISCQKVLSVTGIELASHVINPYRGCAVGCTYCYARKNKCFEKRAGAWGTFVDIKINAPEILKKELQTIRPTRVLIGSTTEVYQAAEQDTRLTATLLSILNEHAIPYTILTKSPLITRDAGLIQKSPLNRVCFTINSPIIRTLFEQCSSPLEQRVTAIQKLIRAGIDTYAYISPLFPFLTHAADLIDSIAGIVQRIDCESCNLKMAAWNDMKAILAQHDATTAARVEHLFSDKRQYDLFWNSLREELSAHAQQRSIKINLFFHSFDSYYKPYTTTI